MRKNVFNLLAKLISIVYIIFITLLAFDEQLFSVGFLVHLVPTFILLVILLIALKKPKFGGIVFAIAGFGTVIFFNTYRELVAFITISLIPIIIGVLFWFSKKH